MRPNANDAARPAVRTLAMVVGCLGALALAQFLAPATTAQPFRLKLAFYESRDTAAYLYGIKPFVESVNAEGNGLLTIEVFSNGALGAALAEQPRLVTDGVADIAFVIPGQTPYRFPDNKLLELPGLFQDLREGTMVYTRLIAANRLSGYENFVVIGAYTTGPNFIHSGKPIRSLGDLKAQKIRANNQIEASVLEGLGATPTVLPVPRIADTIAKGAIDGAALAPTALVDYHIASLTPNHYLLRSGVNPLVLIMNRKKFESLPDAAQAIIRKYSGDRAATIWIESYGRNEQNIFERIRSDARHRIVEPTEADAQTAGRVFGSIIGSWASEGSRNKDLLNHLQAELTTLRSAK